MNFRSQLSDYVEFDLPLQPNAKSIKFYKSLGFAMARGSAKNPAYWMAADGVVQLAFYPRSFRLHLNFFSGDLELTLDHLSQHNIIPYAYDRGLSLKVISPEKLHLCVTPLPGNFRVPQASPVKLGTFAEFSVPSSDLDASLNFWTAFGFQFIKSSSDTYDFYLISNGKLAIGLHGNPRLRGPYFSYSSLTAFKVINTLKAQGLSFSQELSQPDQEIAHGLFKAPGNISFLLFQQLGIPKNDS